jgi:hemerythrin-like domain-containing protein
MTEALPATGDAPAEKLCSARDLILIHLAFRRLYSLAPQAVRLANRSDRRRIDSIATNVTRINEALHHHHQLEDARFWDLLEGRRPACALHVEAMKRDHAAVAALIDETPALIAAWKTAPAPATATPLADKLDEIGRVLGDHLTAEEAQIVPVIEEVITSKEWEDIGTEAQKSYHRSQIFMFYGLFLEIMSPEERAELEPEVPLPIRIMYALIGRRQYEKIMRDLRPAA